jgi:hypothetical protein
MPFAPFRNTIPEPRRASMSVLAVAIAAGGVSGAVAIALLDHTPFSNSGGRVVLSALAIAFAVRARAIRRRRRTNWAPILVPAFAVFVFASATEDAALWAARAIGLVVAALAGWVVAHVAVRTLRVTRNGAALAAAAVGAGAIVASIALVAHEARIPRFALAGTLAAAFAGVLFWSSRAARSAVWCPSCAIPADLVRSIQRGEPDSALLRGAVERGSLAELLALPESRDGTLYVDISGCPRCGSELCFDVLCIGESGTREQPVLRAAFDATTRADLARALGEGGYR